MPSGYSVIHHFVSSVSMKSLHFGSCFLCQTWEGCEADKSGLQAYLGSESEEDELLEQQKLSSSDRYRQLLTGAATAGKTNAELDKASYLNVLSSSIICSKLPD